MPALNDEYITMLAHEGNGAVEAALPEGEPLVLVLIGPIKTWWGRMDSPEYKEYFEWREAIRVEAIHQGHLVYSPHKAWQGAWHEKAQRVNDKAIALADAVIVLTPPDTEAVGTAAEIEVALSHGKPVVYAPPGGAAQLKSVMAKLATIPAE